MVETLLTNAVGREVEHLQPHLLLSYTCTNVPHTTILEWGGVGREGVIISSVAYPGQGTMYQDPKGLREV